MDTTDLLTIIPANDWAQLRDLYLKNWPEHHVAYATIDNYLRWYEKDPAIKNLTIYCLNGSWREDGTYLVVVTDRLTIIPANDWAQLRDLYLKNWPEHHVAYTTIDNYVRWYGKDPAIKNLIIYCLNESWREDGTYLVVDRYQLFVYSLDPTNRTLARALPLLDWSGGLKVSSLLARHRQPVIDVITAKGLTKEYDSFVFGRLNIHHLDYIYNQWPLKDHISYEAGHGLLARLIRLNESVGILE
ncbi:hypothetical protein AND_003338 [Anopheles darlingi]|uniref:Uncharacterized protein n=1 Tax=Anopheles darlingi TaxID=43151 RepID=W5JLD0_ANODA|nr:hypothetical protein AND_003338 [Anopheles darlingi]